MKTAVDILINKIQDRIINIDNSCIKKNNDAACTLYLFKILEECNEAKEIEKQQIIDAHGDKLKKSSGVTNYEYWFSGEDYYNKKYNL